MKIILLFVGYAVRKTYFYRHINILYYCIFIYAIVYQLYMIYYKYITVLY